MITAFGKELRNIRLNRDLLLKNMADALGVTSSYLSAIEHGKKSVPKNMISKLAMLFDLSEKEISNLKAAQNISSDEVKISLNGLTSDQKKMANAFARRLTDLSDEEMKKMWEFIKESD